MTASTTSLRISSTNAVRAVAIDRKDGADDRPFGHAATAGRSPVTLLLVA